MKREVTAALERLLSSGEEFDRVVRVLQRNRHSATPVLAKLLSHPDPGWRTGAAVAFARIRMTPRRCLPGLLDLLRSKDARAQIASISAIEWLPAPTRDLAVPAIIRVLASRPTGVPVFTQGWANVPRGVAAHFLGTYGGLRGLAALRRAAERRGDPINHQIESALSAVQAKRGHFSL